MLGNLSALPTRADYTAHFRLSRSHFLTGSGLAGEIRSFSRGFRLTAFILDNLRSIFSSSGGPEGDLSRKTMPAGLERPWGGCIFFYFRLQ